MCSSFICHSFICPLFICFFIIHSFIHSLAFIHLFIHSFIHSSAIINIHSSAQSFKFITFPLIHFPLHRFWPIVLVVLIVGVVAIVWRLLRRKRTDAARVSGDAIQPEVKNDPLFHKRLKNTVISHSNKFRKANKIYIIVIFNFLVKNRYCLMRNISL